MGVEGGEGGEGEGGEGGEGVMFHDEEGRPLETPSMVEPLPLCVTTDNNNHHNDKNDDNKDDDNNNDEDDGDSDDEEDEEDEEEVEEGGTGRRTPVISTEVVLECLTINHRDDSDRDYHEGREATTSTTTATATTTAASATATATANGSDKSSLADNDDAFFLSTHKRNLSERNEVSGDGGRGGEGGEDEEEMRDVEMANQKLAQVRLDIVCFLPGYPT